MPSDNVGPKPSAEGRGRRVSRKGTASDCSAEIFLDLDKLEACELDALRLELASQGFILEPLARGNGTEYRLIGDGRKGMTLEGMAAVVSDLNERARAYEDAGFKFPLTGEPEEEDLPFEAELPTATGDCSDPVNHVAGQVTAILDLKEALFYPPDLLPPVRIKEYAFFPGQRRGGRLEKAVRVIALCYAERPSRLDHSLKLALLEQYAVEDRVWRLWAANVAILDQNRPEREFDLAMSERGKYLHRYLMPPCAEPAVVPSCEKEAS